MTGTAFTDAKPPRAQGASRQATVGGWDSWGPSTPVVLLVESDFALRSGIKFALEIEGYHVEAFGDAETLLACALPAEGCLVLDHRLPGATGLHAIELLRRRGVTLPAVLISWRLPRALREVAVKAGVRLIELPLLGDDLLGAIIEAVEA